MPADETYFAYAAGDDNEWKRVDEPELARQLHAEGLIWAVNRAVLHRAGIALGVAVSNLDREKMTGDVKGLSLEAGITHYADEGQYADVDARNLAKLREHGHDDVATALESLIAALG